MSSTKSKYVQKVRYRGPEKRPTMWKARILLPTGVGISTKDWLSVPVPTQEEAGKLAFACVSKHAHEFKSSLTNAVQQQFKEW